VTGGAAHPGRGVEDNVGEPAGLAFDDGPDGLRVFEHSPRRACSASSSRTASHVGDPRTVAILGLGVLGAGALLGDVASAAGQIGPAAAQGAQQAAAQTPPVDPAQALQSPTRGRAASGLGLTVAAAAGGGLAGSAMRNRPRTTR